MLKSDRLVFERRFPVETMPGILLNRTLIKVIISQAGPYNKTGDAKKGVGVAKFDFTKIFRNQLFSRVRVLYHQWSITNHSESI